MRSPLELLKLPFSFWQLPLLTEAQFDRAARDRGVRFSVGQIEGFHRQRLLTPIFRVQRDGRSIAAAVRRNDPYVWELADRLPANRDELLEAHEAGRLHDPTQEYFIARKRLDRQVGDIPYRASAYLYSHHQLLMLPILRSAQPLMRYSKAGPAQGIDPSHHLQFDIWRNHANWLKPIVIALSALEPIYYPKVIRRIRYHADEIERCERWNRRFGVGGLLHWLNVDADWLTNTAAALLDLADNSDPLGAWSEVVRESDPTGWEKLGGEARSAVDLRIGAEVLLRYYERLSRGPLAPKLKTPPPRAHDPLAKRLKPQGELDHTLGKFGLSPHPRLVLVVEGHTELFVLPLLMDHFGIRRDRDFIAIENAQGVGSDISLLIAYAVAPQTKEAEHGRYLRLLKPPTRLLAIMDPEGKYATAEGREKRRQVWIDRILETLPFAHRTPAVRESISRLVAVRTWDKKHQSFEFAHFTDREIAMASSAIDPRTPSPMSLQKRVEVARNLRLSQGKLDSLLGGASKVDLARILWPVLLNKVKLAEKRKTESRIAAVGVIDEALKIAHEFPRQNLVIPLVKAGS